MHRFATISAIAATLAVAAPLSAQRADTNRNAVPDKQRPPAGMCRIWLDGVPAGQQPAPTDCATAIRHRPPNGHVVFGDPVQAPKVERHALPQVERFAPPARDQEQNAPRSAPPDRSPRVDSSKPPHPRHARPVRKDTSERPSPRAMRAARGWRP